jgi:GNAT superfamily N-acetyltransferase
MAMTLAARSVVVEDILPWRDLYRQEMRCQIVHDNMSYRKGWTEPYLLEIDGAAVGYGSVLVGGPWTGTRALFEFYVIPPKRSRAFDLFERLREASKPSGMEIQSNDVLITAMLHVFAHEIKSESIVFEDQITTAHSVDGAVLRPPVEGEGDWVLEVDGEAAANGGILYHYNRPYGDIYMGVKEPFRRRGLGSYLVQELKRTCYERGSVPGARCNPENVASRRTLQKAGFVPYAHILTGKF